MAFVEGSIQDLSHLQLGEGHRFLVAAALILLCLLFTNLARHVWDVGLSVGQPFCPFPNPGVNTKLGILHLAMQEGWGIQTLHGVCKVVSLEDIWGFCDPIFDDGVNPSIHIVFLVEDVQGHSFVFSSLIYAELVDLVLDGDLGECILALQVGLVECIICIRQFIQCVLHHLVDVGRQQALAHFVSHFPLGELWDQIQLGLGHCARSFAQDKLFKV